MATASFANLMDFSFRVLRIQDDQDSAELQLNQNKLLP
jgi:hypothetical protein